MKKNSFFRNTKLRIDYVICILVLVLFSGCYSFTGGSVPEHLKTLYIATINDNSGYGDPRYREQLTQLIIDKFRNDNSLKIVDRNGDARLSIVISSIKDETLVVRPGEVETERKISVTCDVDYFDAVKKKEIFKKPMTNSIVYPLANAVTERNKAISKAFEQLSDDILLAVVSGW